MILPGVTPCFAVLIAGCNVFVCAQMGPNRLRTAQDTVDFVMTVAQRGLVRIYTTVKGPLTKTILKRLLFTIVHLFTTIHHT